MMVNKITGAKNSKVKLTKSLLLKKNRLKNQMFTVEGIKSVKDAVGANADIAMIFMSESFYEEENLNDFSEYDIFVLPEHIFLSLCDTQTPQGILAVIRIGQEKKLMLDINRLYIYCDNVSDPGNLGTIIRTADAAGFGGVLLSKGCADLYSPKTIRSSMGSFFHIPVYEGMEKSDIADIKKLGFKFYCGALSENTVEYTSVDYTEPSVIAVGNEANGITDEILELADACIKIPILGAAESLNVGVASSILMYEALRQRNKKIS